MSFRCRQRIQPIAQMNIFDRLQSNFQQDFVCVKQRWIDCLCWTSNSIKSISPEHAKYFKRKYPTIASSASISKVYVLVRQLYDETESYFFLF